MNIFITAVILVFALFGAPKVWAVPADPESVSLLSLAQVKSELQPEKHLPNVRTIAIYEKWQEKPQSILSDLKILQEQKIAIKQARSLRVPELVTLLVPYLDYPARGSVPTYPPSGESTLSEALDAWPAFNAIYNLGQEAIPPLSVTIRDSDKDLRLRLTALQVLTIINKSIAENLGDELKQSALKQKQQPLAELVNTIVTGQKPFWGMVEFQPITMSAQQVAELISTQQHLQKPGLAMSLPTLLPLDTPRTEKDLAQADFDKYERQKEAIRNAGELKLVALIPNLLLYMDYPANENSYVTSATSYSLRNRRRRWPALNAILNMGPAATVSLQQFVVDKAQTFKLRQTALSVLRDLAPDLATISGQSLLEEAKQKGDKESQNAIEFTLQRDENTSFLTTLKRDESKAK